MHEEEKKGRRENMFVWRVRVIYKPRGSWTTTSLKRVEKEEAEKRRENWESRGR